MDKIIVEFDPNKMPCNRCGKIVGENFVNYAGQEIVCFKCAPAADVRYIKALRKAGL